MLDIYFILKLDLGVKGLFALSLTDRTESKVRTETESENRMERKALVEIKVKGQKGKVIKAQKWNLGVNGIYHGRRWLKKINWTLQKIILLSKHITIV